MGGGDRDRREVLEGVDLGETTRVFAGMVRAGWLVRDGGEHHLVCRIRNLLVPCLGGKLSRRSESMGLVGCHQPLMRPRVALGFVIVPDDQLCGIFMVQPCSASCPLPILGES